MQRKSLQPHNQQGFTLLVAVLVTGIVLAIGLAILNITLKEFILSGIARESVIALNAADAGMECALYWDRSTKGDKFDVVGEPTAPPSGTPFTCMGQTKTTTGAASAAPQQFQFSWGNPATCAIIEVTKYYPTAVGGADMGVTPPRNCPQGVECTRVESRGYNKGCAEIGTNPRTVERALRTLY